MDIKTIRQRAIQTEITHGRYGDQQALVEILSTKYRIITTQAVISRDLKEMGVVKEVDEKGRYYVLHSKNVEKEILKRAVKKIVHNGSMIVIHTLPATAAFVGDVLDESHQEILGCLSGENVVFVAPCDVKKIDRLCKQLAEYLGVEYA